MGVISEEGARKLAAIILHVHVEDAERGDLDARAFLMHSREAEIYFAACDINPEAARQQLAANWIITRKNDDYLAVVDMARKLNTSVETITGYIRNGKLPGFKLKREWRVRKQDFENFLSGYERYRRY